MSERGKRYDELIEVERENCLKCDGGANGEEREMERKRRRNTKRKGEE